MIKKNIHARSVRKVLDPKFPYQDIIASVQVVNFTFVMNLAKPSHEKIALGHIMINSTNMCHSLMTFK